MKVVVPQAFSQRRERYRLNRPRRDSLFWRCFLPALAVGGAVFTLLLLWGISVGDQHRQAVRKHWTKEAGTIVQRGPYQGDAAYSSYRLAVIKYRAWDGDSRMVERLVPWSASIGDVTTVYAGDKGGVYIEADLNRSASNPYYPSTNQRVIPIATAGTVVAIASLAGSWWVMYCLMLWWDWRRQLRKRRNVVVAT